MKFYDTHFDEYISHDKESLHPDLAKVYDKFPKSLRDLKNIIFYGPSGAGKYTQMLAAIKKYSPSELKYEKKLSITYNKNNYVFKRKSQTRISFVFKKRITSPNLPLVRGGGIHS